MSQGIFSTINPNTTSGTQLATILDDFKNAIVSGFSGTSRPSDLQANGYWIDTTNSGLGILDYKLYDGTNDITIYTINKNTQSIILPGVSDEFEVLKISDDTIGAGVVLKKKRATGGGQVLTGDALGDIDFEGTDSSDISYVQARIRVISTDDVSSSEQGSYMAMSVTPTDGSSLTEVLRLTGDRRLGVGVVAPEKTIDVFASNDSAGIQTTIAEDSTSAPEIIIQKKRVASSGQILSGDKIGSHIFKSVDNNGDVVEVARVDVDATQTHTTANQGASFKISTKSDDSNSFVEALKLENGEVSLYGKKLTDIINPSVALLSGTNELLSVDGSIYGAFKAEIFIHGENASIARQQELIIKGVYDLKNTTWKISYESDSMGGSDSAISITPNDAETLTVDYTNEIPTFVSGKIYTKITRYLL